jgi:catechol 2,3-dioxygenase-like lactoylglutathione lyase family enzyme
MTTNTTTTDTTTEITVWLDGLTLQVTDVERSRAFYQQIPGAELLDRINFGLVAEHHRLGEFALLRIGQARRGILGFGAPGFHLEISASDVDHLHTILTQTGMTPTGPPEDRPWGERTFNVIDPDGNHIEFSGG